MKLFLLLVEIGHMYTTTHVADWDHVNSFQVNSIAQYL